MAVQTVTAQDVKTQVTDQARQVVASLHENQLMAEKLAQLSEENKLLRDLVNTEESGKLSVNFSQLVQKSRKSGRPITEAQIDKV